MAYERNAGFVEHFTSLGKHKPPRHLNARFDEIGKFLPLAGNTIVCHLTQGSATQRAVIQVREALKSMPYGDHFAYTPISSLHMTVLQGITDDGRTKDCWPAGLPLDASVEETTSYFLERLEDFPKAPHLRMKPIEVTPLGLVLTGATSGDESAIRSLRDDLTRPFEFRHPDHDTYTFHVTLAYLAAWLPEGAELQYLPALADLGAALAAEIDVMELDRPAFCTFDDMTEFRPCKTL